MSTAQRILVVDDVEDNREIVRARLESHGFTVTTADDGEAALAAVAAAPPIIAGVWPQTAAHGPISGAT